MSFYLDSVISFMVYFNNLLICLLSSDFCLPVIYSLCSHQGDFLNMSSSFSYSKSFLAPQFIQNKGQRPYLQWPRCGFRLLADFSSDPSVGPLCSKHPILLLSEDTPAGPGFSLHPLQTPLLSPPHGLLPHILQVFS